ncbi:MAG: NAD(P)H-hydrate dehydratase [Anaerolineales bacterium]|nr:NAD(P)H-hydrate dehydratase [Anaerolineales bacterium]
MAKLVTVSEMVAIEQAADAAGWSYAHMMEAAGASLAESVTAHSHSPEKSVVALVGPGNNGGDALVALRLLAAEGCKAQALLVGERPAGDKLAQQAKKAGVTVKPFTLRSARAALARSTVVLDALLGTGARLPLREPFAQALELAAQVLAAREQPPLLVAVDCPSGMDCQNGEVAPQTLAADLTVCMAAIKQGMLTVSAFPYLGQLEVGDIGLPADLPAWGAIRREVIDSSMAQAALPRRPLDAHKGTFGTAMIVAGSQKFPGAALLAAEAAYRSGAGLVSVAASAGVQAALAGHLPEATWQLLPQADGGIAAEAAPQLAEALSRSTAMLLGPGLGRAAATGAFVRAALDLTLPPLVVDADGLRWLVEIEDWPQHLPPGTVLTPHPGEMEALSGLSSDQIQANRLELAEQYAQMWGHVLVLKGAFTVVAASDGRSALLPLATPALARAGSGDVLAGIITGLRAQGVPAYEAACAGAWLHGQAALRAAARLGGIGGVLAGDLAAELPALMGG